MNDIEKRVLETIREEHITPTSKWVFKAKDYTLWLSFALSILIGSVGFGIITFLLLDNDWNVYDDLEINQATHIFQSIPYFWISILAVAVFLAYFNFTHTRKGYKARMLYALGGSAVAGIIIGVSLYATNSAEYAENIIAQRIPFYENLVQSKKTIWNNRANGLLGGTIRKVSDDDNFTVEDFKGKIWNISGKNIFNENEIENLVSTDTRVRMVGRFGSTSSFEVIEIRPW